MVTVIIYLKKKTVTKWGKLPKSDYLISPMVIF